MIPKSGTRFSDKIMLKKENAMRIAIALLTLMLATPAIADEKLIELKKAPGLDKVEANCAACHSLDYIVMNSPYPLGCVFPRGCPGRRCHSSPRARYGGCAVSRPVSRTKQPSIVVA